MHIPRQPDAVRVVHPGRRSGTDGLRVRRQHLVEQLRAVSYWQRLVQARTDLVVAGLLYTAPVPTSRDRSPLDLDPGAPAARGPVAEELHALDHPPACLDVPRLLGGLRPTEDAGPEGPGAHLDRLREAAAALAAHRRLITDDLGAVTLALHDRLAADGSEDSGGPFESLWDRAGDCAGQRAGDRVAGPGLPAGT